MSNIGKSLSPTYEMASNKRRSKEYTASSNTLMNINHMAEKTFLVRDRSQVAEKSITNLDGAHVFVAQEDVHRGIAVLWPSRK
jgi:hypothetical protein